MMKYEIDKEGWAHLEVSGTAQEITADVCTLIARILAHLDEENKNAFSFAIVKFLADGEEQGLMYKIKEDGTDERE